MLALAEDHLKPEGIRDLSWCGVRLSTISAPPVFAAAMESLQGPINSCFLGEHLGVDYCLEQRSGLDFSFGAFLASTDGLKGDDSSFANFSVDDKMPFLQMLGVESPSILPSTTTTTEPNFQLLLRLQEQKKQWKSSCFFPESDARVPALELESCLTSHASESHSPVKSETKEHHCPRVSSSCQEVASTACNPEPNSPENFKDGNSGSSSLMWTRSHRKGPSEKASSSPPTTREKRKRKRTKPCKNREEVESQRMTHIAVERNRRKQMNDHLNALRSLMPSSFIQRGDQASIIGGAIDFVKELEQLLQSLQAQKRKRRTEEEGDDDERGLLDPNPSSIRTARTTTPPFDGFFTSPQYTCYTGGGGGGGGGGGSPKSDVKSLIDSYINGGKFTAENKTAVADIEVTLIQTHVNLKVLCPRRSGQLLKAIHALEHLSLTVLHLNVTSLHPSVLYSFNLKIEEECKLSSADEIAAAVYQIFRYINSN